MNPVEIQDATLDYGGFTALHGLDLQLGAGEVLGLLGHNGAGKTTTIKLILGLLRPTRGSVRVFGQSPGDPAVRRRIGFLPENVTFYPQLSGRETLQHFARLKGARPAEVDELLEQVGLGHAAQRRVKTYSKGMRQRLGLAQALLGQPQLLLLDEPTVGLDPLATIELYQWLDRLRAQGTGIILCSHVLPGVESHIDRAAILAKGRLLTAGSLADLRRDARLPVRIRYAGRLDGDWPQHWREAGHGVTALDGRRVEVRVGEAHQHEVLSVLLAEQAQELEVLPPSLADLYRHHMQSAHAGVPT
ncbi:MULTISPECIES: ABC transporter ATP-binding protein [Pseudomonas]|uniref:ABC transporter ATP-binding protein n=1 Tax=Pseudomonas nitroreducens TaxID=46680 RepID=A0ABS0KLZ8_PSENT|nr:MULTISPECIES: ABC transporter ATP-binding protein [Pseudomonas]MBG6288954.1 ABC transporter ATP-binding protein [Pseudomonas nitroreducens]NMZ60150.1 ABC transporter ATP-binding protein [Pseudomonas nitroreducens]OBY60971.1 copper ABC transporter ATP-binding protein [Pseudomonas sp. AU12215]SNS92546.1 Cu-processing system ATP-binding protein [Pseudomonas nitroreducens]